MLDASPSTRNGITATYLPCESAGSPGFTTELAPPTAVREIISLVFGIARKSPAARSTAAAGATHFQGILLGAVDARMMMEAIPGRLPCQASRSATISAAFG